MPFEGAHANDIGLTLFEGPVCKFDAQDGTLKSPEEIFEGGICFYADATTGGDRELATRLTRRNMKSLPYWQLHPFALLSGAVATDQEHEDAIAKL